MLALLPLLAAAAATAGFDHAPWDALLKRHVNALGEVDYGALKCARAPLDVYVAALAAQSPDSHPAAFPSRADQLAYWINAYNALTIKGVVDAYPTRSVRNLGMAFGFFRRKDYTLGGRRLSLQDLENTIIRGCFGEPRIHFAIVCASVSCPLLLRDAYTGANLETLLDRATRISMMQARTVTIDKAARRVTLTTLFNWYAKDFGGAAAVLPFVRRHLTPERQRELDALGASSKVKYFEYDWAINEPGARAKSIYAHERAMSQ
ncbi:MAG: DUF547 domain-containing protein [Acidobacteria bacterium]|nr:DUF547 domain-containing protein [Acidobacteriota bacterium]